MTRFDRDDAYDYDRYLDNLTDPTSRWSKRMSDGKKKIVIKVFSSTMQKDRDSLGEKVTDWLRGASSRLDITEIRTLQSSDNEFHCLTMIIFAEERP